MNFSSFYITAHNEREEKSSFKVFKDARSLNAKQKTKTDEELREINKKNFCSLSGSHRNCVAKKINLFKEGA